MVFLQTSNQPLAFKDSASGRVNVFLGMQEAPKTSQEAKTPPSYRYASALYINQAATDSAILQAMFHTATLTPLDLPTLKAIKLAQINASYQEALDLITQATPQAEIQSWATQESEAKAYQASQEAQTPYIDSLAKARGVERGELVAKILEKAQIFSTLSATLTGSRQKCEDAIAKAQNAKDLEAIIFSPKAEQENAQDDAQTYEEQA